MHETNTQNAGSDLDTGELKKIAELEGSIEKRLEKAREEAAKITANAREDAENALETAREEAASEKTREIEHVRLEEIEKSKLLIQQAEKTAVEITSINTEKVSKKLFNEFISLIGG